MSTIKQILRLYLDGKGKKTIAASLGISPTTVKRYIRLLQQSGQDLSTLLQMSDEDLLQVVASTQQLKDNKRFLELQELFPDFSKRLSSVGMTREILWYEYKQKYPEGYKYSTFCEHFKGYLDQQGGSMHFTHQPGDKVFVDYTGKKLSYVDIETGEIIPCEVLVMVLGFSQLTYVEATLSQGLKDFIPAICNGLEYFGGAPKALVPDNLKSAIHEASNYEPIANPTFLEMANHYQTGIYAARGYKPKDKALVERYVSIIYTRIFTVLEKQTFFSLQELNQAILQELAKHNLMLFQGRPYSRRDLFEEQERSCLTPLPSERFEIFDYKMVKVMKNGHMQLSEDKHYYSVPYRYIGEKVKLSYSKTLVKIFLNHKQIAVHLRNRKAFGYTTEKEHMSSQNRFVSEWNPDMFINWARKIDPQVEQYIRAVLSLKIYPEQLYRSCVGILKMKDKVGKERLVAACEKGNDLQTYGYHFIKRILKNKLENLNTEIPVRDLPKHDNIRGKHNYN